MSLAEDSHHVRGSHEQVKEAGQKVEATTEVHRECASPAKVKPAHPTQGVLQLLGVVRSEGLQSAHGQGAGECMSVPFLSLSQKVIYHKNY